MGLVLWIDQNTFATGLLEKVFKKREDCTFYSVKNVDDFAFLVDDLRPSVIVLDGSTYALNPEAFKRQYEASVFMQSIPFILLEAHPDLTFIKSKIGELQRPFDPFKIPEKIAEILKLN